MEKNIIQKEIENFDKIIKDMELKTKENFINNIKIKENLKTIKRTENKNNILDELIFDKKGELNILKQLIILKEQKKLDFEDIISKYLYQLLLINKSTNNKIDKLKRNNLIINKKQKIINKLLDNLNNEFYNYLDNDNENIKNKNEKKYSLTNVFSNGVNKYLYKEPSSCKVKNNKYNLINEDDKLKKIELNNIEIDEYTKNFQNYINKNKINSKDNNTDKNQINNINNIKKKNNNYNDFINIKQINNNKNNINNINKINNNNKNLNNNEKNIIQQNKFNFKANKNLKKSRDNLKYLISQNENEKLNKQKINNYYNFIKLLFLKLRKYNINIIKNYFNKLKNYNTQLKLINLLNKSIINKRFIIISKINEILQKLSLIYNEAINEEIINEDIFLNNIYLNQINVNEKNKINSMKIYKSNLNKMKFINKEMNDIKNKILKFAENI